MNLSFIWYTWMESLSSPFLGVQQLFGVHRQHLPCRLPWVNTLWPSQRSNKKVLCVYFGSGNIQKFCINEDWDEAGKSIAICTQSCLVISVQADSLFLRVWNDRVPSAIPCALDFLSLLFPGLYFFLYKWASHHKDTTPKPLPKLSGFSLPG